MAKQRLAPSQWKASVAPAVLYRHDLEELANLVGGAKYIIGDYRYDSIDEVAADRGRAIKRLKLAAFHNGKETTAVDLGTGVTIVSNDQGRGLQIKEFLKSRRTIWARHPDLVPLLFLIPTLCLVMGINHQLDPGGSANELPVWQFLLVLGLVFFGMRWTSSWRRQCRITTLAEHEHRSSAFWARNKDKYLLEAARVVLSSIVGGFAGWFLRDYFGG